MFQINIERLEKRHFNQETKIASMEKIPEIETI